MAVLFLHQMYVCGVKRLSCGLRCEYAYVCAGTGEELTVCVKTVKVLGHQELIGISKLTMLVMSEGEEQRLLHTGLSYLGAMLGFVQGRLTVT